MRRTVALFHSTKTAAFLVASMFVLLPACGNQLVEFPDTDGGRADTGKADRAAADAVGPDINKADTANTDLAGIDVANAEVANRDAGIPDSGLPDAQNRDTRATDVPTNDARNTDLRIIDGNPIDANSIDVNTADVITTDGNSDAELSACRQLPVPLGSADNFVVLAGSTVTNTGLSTLTGDMGVSPGTAVTGFPPGTIVGAQHAGDPIAAQGIADLTTAYNDAAGRVLCAITVAGNLGGRTLAPGLYRSTSSLAISSGDLTLDAQGDSSAVFIFQMASTLTTTSGRQVILSGGAKSSNVFWQVGTSATLGTLSVFQGSIMANQAVTLNTGATLNGRALARIAGVSLDANTVVKPSR
jgi:hypothetical protein